MKSTFRRIVAAFSLAALVSVIAASPANAADAPTGVGTSFGSVSLLSLDYGDIIKATLLGEGNSDTIDPAVGVPTATETLSPLSVHSVTLAPLNALSVPPVQTTTTGALDQKNTALLDLSTLGVPAVTGTVNPATLSSLVDTTGAQSALTSTLANLGLAGLVNIDSASLNLGGVAGPTASTASRALSADAVTVLDLQALLNLLGTDVANLPIETIIDLLDQLDEVGIVNGLSTLVTTESAADLRDLLDTLNAGIDSAQSTLDAEVSALGLAQTVHTTAIAVCDLIVGQTAKQACIDAADAVLATAQATKDAAQAAVDLLQGLLDGLLETLVDVLAGTPLLAVDGVSAGAVATAKDTVGNSSATVTGTINGIRLGGIDLGGVNANATLDQIAELGTTITTTLNGVLTTISPSLGDLLNVALLQRSTSVSQVGEYINAVAGITALNITITPPDICALLTDIFLLDGTLIPPDLDLPLAPVQDVLDELDSVVECGGPQGLSVQPARIVESFPVVALTGPINFKAANVSSTAVFKKVAAPIVPEQPALPRTGMNETLLLIVGGLMAAVALGLRRASTPVKVTESRIKQ